MSDLAFAYGSNLCDEDWARFCREAGAEPHVLRRAGRGFLADHELVFSRWSHGRGGGVLGLRPRVGQVVDGWLFEVLSPLGWQLLDAKEGAPRGYRREARTILRPRGRVVTAAVYDVRQPEPFVEPAAEYLQVVRRARQRLGLDTTVLDGVAADRAAPWLIPHLFQYDLPGIRPSAIIEGIAGISESAWVAGHLAPARGGWALREGAGALPGRCITLDDPGAQLAAIDAAMSAAGLRRAITRCHRGDDNVWAWHYRAGAPAT